MKKLIIAAGTGFLGKALINYYKNSVDELIILTRSKHEDQGNVKYLVWDAHSVGTWASALNGADVLINLAGKSVDCRYNEKNRKEILASRIESTRVLAEAIKLTALPPPVWINSASATIYIHSESRPMDEFTGETGNDFSMTICKEWERTFFEGEMPDTRRIALRIGLVLGNNGGVFTKLKQLIKMGLGGTIGNGKQMVNWVYEKDFLRMVDWAIRNRNCKGAYNCVSPKPLPNKEFMRTLRKKLNVTVAFPTPAPLLSVGAFFIGTEPELVLKSRFVIPKKATDEGFVFEYAELNTALDDMLKS
ncbi:MAG: TIGR01777 family oxidoreductase [Bacteroidia bacterium]